MSNAMQNSSLVSQINQIFSSNSLTPSAHTQIENKPKESFNKIYKNELANGARKTTEANKLPPKNNTQQATTDKTVNAPKSEETQTQNKTVSGDEDSDNSENQTLLDTSALLDLVDHIVAIANQPIGNSERKNLSTEENNPAVIKINTNIVAPNQTIDATQKSDILDAAPLTDVTSIHKADQPKAEIIHTEAGFAPIETKTSQEVSTSKHTIAHEDTVDRSASLPLQAEPITTPAKNEILPALPPSSFQIPEKNARDNKDNLTILSSAQNTKTHASGDETIVTSQELPIQEQDALGSRKLPPTSFEPNSKAELFSKELASRFTENKVPLAEHGQANAPVAITSVLPALPPAPGAAINGLTATQMQDFISPRVGAKGWDQALGQKMIWMVAGEESSVQLSLNPPDLGPLQVVLSVNDNQIDASFVSAHLDVREAIEAASPKLKEMMENAGISLSGFSVSAQAQSSDHAFAQAQQQRSMTNANNPAKLENGNTENPSLHQTRSPVSTGKGLVDTFV